MNLKTPKVEGRKKERPLQPINLKSTKVEGRNYASPVPQASAPFGEDFEQCFKAGRKENEQRNDPARFSENPFRYYIGCPPARTDKFEMTEGRAAKKRAPATTDEFEITEGRGTQLHDHRPASVSPFQQRVRAMF